MGADRPRAHSLGTKIPILDVMDQALGGHRGAYSLRAYSLGGQTTDFGLIDQTLGVYSVGLSDHRFRIWSIIHQS